MTARGAGCECLLDSMSLSLLIDRPAGAGSLSTSYRKESPPVRHGVGELPLAGSGLFSGQPGIGRAYRILTVTDSPQPPSEVKTRAAASQRPRRRLSRQRHPARSTADVERSRPGARRIASSRGFATFGWGKRSTWTRLNTGSGIRGSRWKGQSQTRTEGGV